MLYLWSLPIKMGMKNHDLVSGNLCSSHGKNTKFCLVYHRTKSATFHGYMNLPEITTFERVSQGMLLLKMAWNTNYTPKQKKSHTTVNTCFHSKHQCFSTVLYFFPRFHVSFEGPNLRGGCGVNRWGGMQKTSKGAWFLFIVWPSSRQKDDGSTWANLF